MRFGITVTSGILPKLLRIRLRPVNECVIANPVSTAGDLVFVPNPIGNSTITDCSVTRRFSGKASLPRPLKPTVHLLSDNGTPEIRRAVSYLKTHLRPERLSSKKGASSLSLRYVKSSTQNAPQPASDGCGA
jgi:hypothetical protein